MFRKEPLNPPVPMKPLYWTRLTVSPVNSTVAPEVGQSNQIINPNAAEKW